jgi:single-strand DNA-binding protein
MPLNKEVTLTGNVGKLAEDAAQYTDTGKFIFKFPLAVAVGWGESKKTEWYDVVAWEKTGEIMNQYLTTGSKVQVRGDFKLEFWKSRDGEAKGKLVVTVREFQFLSAKKPEKVGEEEFPF